jgi:hypothetical protein
MAPVTTSSDKNEESKKEDSAAPITSTRVLSPDTLDRYGRLQDALRNFDKDYQSLATPLMDMDQDGEPPFDTDVALEILEKDWARIVAISDTLEDWSPFATDFALGKTLLNRFREFAGSDSTVQSEQDISFRIPSIDSPASFSRETSRLETSTPIAPRIKAPPEPMTDPMFYNFSESEEQRYQALQAKFNKNPKSFSDKEIQEFLKMMYQDRMKKDKAIVTPHLEREKQLEETTKTQEATIAQLKHDLTMATSTFRTTRGAAGRSPQRVHFPDQTSVLDRSIVQQLGTTLDNLVIGQQAQMNRTMSSQIKLPHQQVPTFEGDIKQYPDWWARFSALVHTNPSITNDTIRFSYLKDALKGEAATLLWGISCGQISYDMALKMVQQKYAKPHLIKDQFMTDLLALKAPDNNYKSLSTFHDKANMLIRVLHTNNVPVESFGEAILTTFNQKLPSEIKRCIARAAKAPATTLTLEMFMQHLDEEVSLLQDTQAIKLPGTKDNGPPMTTLTTMTSTTNTNKSYNKGGQPFTARYMCIYCDTKTHYANNCQVIKQPKARYQHVASKKVCMNCFGTHMHRDCTSQFRCQTCKEKHHTSLHQSFKEYKEEKRSKSQSKPKEGKQTVAMFTETTAGKVTLMGIAQGTVANPKDKDVIMPKQNFLLDTCSQETFVTRQLADRLKLPILGTRTQRIEAFEHTSVTKSFDVTQLMVNGRKGKVMLECLIADHIVKPIHTTGWKNAKRAFPDLNLTQLDSSPFEVNIMVGVDQLFKIRRPGIKRNGSLEARDSILGWTVDGPLDTMKGKDTTQSHSMLTTSYFHRTPSVSTPEKSTTTSTTETDSMLKEEISKSTDDELDKKVNQFLDATDFKTDHDQSSDQLMQQLEKTLKFIDGHYEVGLLWKDQHEPLKSNFHMAKAFLASNTAKLQKTNLLDTYNQLIQTGLETGVYEEVPTSEVTGHHLAHFAVMQPNSTTTPVRLVFAGNLGTPSINDCLHTGPSLYQDLPTMLRQFRVNPVAFTGDIAKAFQCLQLPATDRQYLKFLWHKDGDPKKGIVTLRHKMLNFGTNVAPFLLMGTLIIHLQRHHNPVATQLLKKFYSDNFLSGATTTQKAMDLVQASIDILADGGFDLRKFVTNDASLKSFLKKADKLEEKANQSVLGMLWDTTTDMMTYKAPSMRQNQGHTTKRTILQATASFFDPLGFLSPLIMPAVHLLALLWEQDYDWDKPISTEHATTWLHISTQLHLAVEEIKIPRWHSFERDQPINLHVFTDASNMSGGANAYLQQGNHTTLVAVKFKMPAKRCRATITTPKRELEAMALGAKIAYKLQTTYAEVYPQLSLHMWTDSEIALCWLHSNKPVNVFVNNRVAQIRKLAPKATWRHIPSAENSADITSRGLTAADLLASDLYWYGPSVITADSYPEPYTAPDIPQPLHILTTTATVPVPPSILQLVDLDQHHSLPRLRHILRLVLTACYKFKGQTVPSSQSLAKEVSRRLYQAEQAVSLDKELAYLQQPAGHRPTLIKPLKLFLDQDQIIRCGGRLGDSALPYASRYPVLLTRDCKLLNLRIKEAHTTILHAGQEQTKAKLRETVWIPKLTPAVRKIIKDCYNCKRATGPAFRPPGPPKLSAFRLQLEPYKHIGVDLTGHLFVKTSSGETIKVYICIFTCTSSRHINLEILTDQTSESFINALRKHSATYGRPSKILCDNASYFHHSEDLLTERLKDENIEFKFQPANSPWYGAIFERMIGVFKALIRRTLQRKLLNQSDLEVFVKEVAAVVNDRPLTVSSNDLDDGLPLSPNKLLFGRNLIPLPHGDEDEDDPSFLPNDRDLAKHYIAQASRFNKFREQFNKEYLNVLRQRHAYDHQLDPQEPADVEVGDIVIIYNEGHRLSWKLGRVLELLPSRDDQVRAVRLQTKAGETTRALSRLHPLLQDAEVRQDPPATGAGEEQPTAGEDPAQAMPAPPSTPPGPRRSTRAAAADARKKIKQCLID